MALSSELLKKFYQYDVPLPDKLFAAKMLFCRKEFYYINRKEELVLEWLLEIAGLELKRDVWETIRDCLKSDNMKNLTTASQVVEIKSEIKERLIKLLIQSLKYQMEHMDSESEEWPKECSLIRECSIIAMENSIFIFHFRKHMEEFIDLSILILKSAAESGDVEIFIRYVHSTEHLLSQSLKKEDVCELFIEKLYLPIIEAYCALKKLTSENESVMENVNENVKVAEREIVCIIKQVIFPSSHHSQFKSSLQCLFENDTCDSWALKLLSEIWKKHKLSNDNMVALNLYTIIFEAFVHVFQNDFITIYKFLVVICSFLGFEPTIKNDKNNKICLLQKGSISDALNLQIVNALEDCSLSVLKDFLVTLKCVTVILNESINKIPFKQWMQSLILDSVITHRSHFLIFDVINTIIGLNPLIVEPIVNQVLMHVLLLPKESQVDRDNYKLLFLGIFNMFTKLNKIQEFLRNNLFPTLLQVIEDTRLTNSHLLNNLRTVDIIPEEIKHSWTSTVGMLLAVKCITLLRTFKNFLMYGVIKPMEEGQYDGGHRLFLTALEKLFIPFLEGVHLADQTVSQKSGIHFMECLVLLRVCLGKFGAALIQHKYCSISLASYLRICVAVGEVHLLFLVYSPWICLNKSLQMSKSVDPDNSTALQCLMSFLDPKQWNCLVKKIAEEEDENCSKSVSALLLQQLKALVLFEDNVENSKEMQSATCDYLMESLKGVQLIQNSQDAAVLIPLLPLEKLLCLTNDVVEHYTLCESNEEVLNLLKDPVLQENKNLLVSLVWTAVQKIGNLIMKRKRCHDSETTELGHRRLVNDVSSSIEFSKLLHSKMKRKIKESFLVIAEKINKACSDILHSSKNEKVESGLLDFKPLLKHLILLQNLPLPFLPLNTQNFLAFGILGVLIVLSEQRKILTSSSKKTCDAVENVCQEILLGLLEGPTSTSLTEFVDISLMVRLLMQDGRCPKLLLVHLLESGLKNPQYIHKLVEAVRLTDTFVEVNVNFEAPPISAHLLQLLVKKNTSDLPDEERAIYKRDINYLLVMISKYIDCRMKSKQTSIMCVLSLLEAYYVVMSYSSKKTEILKPYAGKFVSAAFSVLENVNAPEDMVSQAQLVLEIVVKNPETVGKGTCKETIWRAYKLNKWPELTAKLLQSASEEDFRRVLVDVCHSLTDITNQLIMFPDLRLPENLVQMAVPPAKARMIEGMLLIVCSAAFDTILQGDSDNELPAFLSFLLTIARRTKVHLPHDLADIILTTIICALRVKSIPCKYVLTVAPTVLQLLTMLLLHHFPLIEDRIPAFLQSYHMVVHAIVMNSSLNLQRTKDDAIKLAKCALQVEQLTLSMRNYYKHFKAISQHIVANLLQEFEKTSMLEEVKVHITNALYGAFNLCDEHARSHLPYTLSPASLELFKTSMSHYKKFHYYTGKV